MDMNLTIVSQFGLKIAGVILTFSCESRCNPQKIKSSRICRDRTKTKNRPRPPKSIIQGAGGRGRSLLDYKSLFLAKIALISFFLNFGTQEGSSKRPPIGPLFSHGENRRHGFFKLILLRLVEKCLKASWEWSRMQSEVLNIDSLTYITNATVCHRSVTSIAPSAHQ